MNEETGCSGRHKRGDERDCPKETLIPWRVAAFACAKKQRLRCGVLEQHKTYARSLRGRRNRFWQLYLEAIIRVAVPTSSCPCSSGEIPYPAALADTDIELQVAAHE